MEHAVILHVGGVVRISSAPYKDAITLFFGLCANCDGLTCQ